MSGWNVRTLAQVLQLRAAPRLQEPGGRKGSREWGRWKGFCGSLRSWQGQFSQWGPCCSILPLEEDEVSQCEVGEGSHLSRSSQSSPPHWSRNSSVFMPPTRSKSDL